MGRDPGPLPATLHLVPHAETYWDELGRLHGWDDSALTSKGRYAASLLAVTLGPIPFRAVYASASPRASATAGILVAGRELPVATADALREIALGKWEGRPVREIAAEEPERFREFRERSDGFHADGGETFPQMRQRLMAFMESAARSHAGEDVLIVSHPIALKALIAAWRNIGPDGLGEMPDPEPCSHSIVQVAWDGRASVLKYAGKSVRNPSGRATALA